jgi:DNA repair exonuclease SbcCD ATPase subunit
MPWTTIDHSELLEQLGGKRGGQGEQKVDFVYNSLGLRGKGPEDGLSEVETMMEQCQHSFKKLGDLHDFKTQIHNLGKNHCNAVNQMIEKSKKRMMEYQEKSQEAAQKCQENMQQKSEIVKTLEQCLERISKLETERKEYWKLNVHIQSTIQTIYDSDTEKMKSMLPTIQANLKQLKEYNQDAYEKLFTQKNISLYEYGYLLSQSISKLINKVDDDLQQQHTLCMQLHHTNSLCTNVCEKATLLQQFSEQRAKDYLDQIEMLKIFHQPAS